MTRFFMAGAAALGMMSGAAMAQSTSMTQQTTTSIPAVSGPVTIANSVSAGSALQADGRKSLSDGSSSADSGGNSTSTTISTTSYPLSTLITTTRKTTTVVNGVPKETVTTTQAYPNSPLPPETTTVTR
jgi:hypothetical protein